MIIIKDKRLNLHMTQEELAEKVGVVQSAISAWESGESKPRSELLPKIAEILGCTIDDLFRDAQTS